MPVYDTCRTCLIHTCGHAGNNLGRADGIDLLLPEGVSTAPIYNTFRTRPLQNYGHAGCYLGRAAGREIPPLEGGRLGYLPRPEKGEPATGLPRPYEITHPPMTPL